MKRLIVVTVLCCMIAALVSPEMVHAKSKVNPFQADNPSFIVGGRVVIPTGQPIYGGPVVIPKEKPSFVSYYEDGRVQEEYYSVNNSSGVPAGIIITYLDEGSVKGKGRISSIIIDNRSSRPTYSIEYFGKTRNVKAVTYQDAFLGNKETWSYNSNGTLKSSDSYCTTGANYGNVLIQSDHIDYTYKTVKGGKIEAVKTTNTYAYDFVSVGSGQYKPVLNHIDVNTETVIFNRKDLSGSGEGIDKKLSPSGDIQDFIEKQNMLNKIANNKEALGNIKITGEIAAKEPRSVIPPANKSQ